MILAFIQNLLDVFTQSFLDLAYSVVNFIPKIIVALVFFAIGWLLAVLIEKLVESVFKSLKIDALLKGAGLEDVMKRTDHNLNSGHFVGVLIKWFVIVVFLISAFDTIGLTQVSAFLSSVVNYLPQVIVAVFILMVAVVVANAMQKLVIASSKAGQIKSAELFGKVTKWSIWIFAVLTALITLGIAPALIQMIVTAVFAGAALAIGLAFGLGGKDVAGRWIQKTSEHIFDKE